MQTDNRVLDEIAKLMMTAAGAAQGAAREAESLVRGRLERLLADLDLVSREEFDAMKALAQAARSETEGLSRRVAVLEAELAERRGRPVG
jgi:BMFP domain-containing protein YqiC